MDQPTNDAKLYELPQWQQHLGRVEYLMLGISGVHGFDRLVQVKLTEPPPTDAALFRLLRQEYWKNRERFYGIKPSWREVKEIHFVKFQTLHASPSQQIIHILDFDRSAEPVQAGWARTAALTFGPRWSRTMAAYFKYPDMAGESRDAFLFPQVPRKLDTDIPRGPGEIGWGLYYVEGPRCNLDGGTIVGIWMALVMALYLLFFV